MAKGVQDIDHGWRRIKRDMRDLGRAKIKVGIRAGKTTAAEQSLDYAKWQATSTRAKRPGPTAQSSVAVVDYALFNEFGTEDIPSRPFMRHTADTQEGALGEYARRQVGPIIDGRRSVDTALKAIAQWYQAAIRRTIRQSPTWAKPNAQATIEMKGSSKPLVDHGVLVDSIDYEITRK